MSFAWKMNILGETWSCELLRCLARDRKSIPQFHYTNWSNDDVFTGVYLERRNLLYKYRGFWTYIEDEKWRYASILRNDTVFIAFSLGYTSYQADHEAAEHFVCHRGPSTKDSEKWLSLYADWLRRIFYCYLLLEN